ncbi:MAG: hypothetical protein QF443_04915 [Dehalococcoidia bacterium]|jgi:hypothetical protein|nr:hypothetical protein [Dehalococcoidia bacterium]
MKWIVKYLTKNGDVTTIIVAASCQSEAISKIIMATPKWCKLINCKIEKKTGL